MNKKETKNSIEARSANNENQRKGAERRKEQKRKTTRERTHVPNRAGSYQARGTTAQCVWARRPECAEPLFGTCYDDWMKFATRGLQISGRGGNALQEGPGPRFGRVGNISAF